MIWRSLIVFSLGLTVAAPAFPGNVTGAIEITNSHDPAVRKNKDYSGVVIWLQPVGHPAPAAPPRHEQMKQKDRHFTPHVLAIPVGSTVDFPNLDPIYHNAFSNFSGQPFDTSLYPPNTSKAQLFKMPGIVRVFCNIHPTMSGIIAVVPSPWYAATPPSGKFTIANVPAGEYELHLFHERSLPEVLQFLERAMTVPAEGLTLPLISISETGYIPTPHMNKYGRPYPPVPTESGYPGARK